MWILSDNATVYRVFGFKHHYFKSNFFQDAWIFLTYFLHNSNVHAIRFQMHYFSLACIANVCKHSTSTACRYFRALICCIPQIPQPWKGNWPSYGLICDNEIHRSRKSLFSRKLFSRKWKIKERNPEDVPKLRTAITTEIFRTITPEMCASACRNVNNRLLRCVANNDGCIS